MSKSKLVSSIPKYLREGIDSPHVSKFLKGFERANMEGAGGPVSFVGELPMHAADYAIKKTTGHKHVMRKAMHKYVSSPALKADIWLGHKLRKIPGAKKLFTMKEQVPLGKGMHQDFTRASALAPLHKAKEVAAPIIVGIGLEKGIRAIGGKKDAQGGDNNRGESGMIGNELREKVASTMLRLHANNKEHEKRAQAVKLLYKQAELGLEPIPSTYNEFEQKLASLVSQDLAVIEKALELTAGNVKMGELSGSDSISPDAAATFQSDVLGD